MEEYGDLSGDGVNPGKVRPLFPITKMAGQGQVVEVVVSKVLTGDNVL